MMTLESDHTAMWDDAADAHMALFRARIDGIVLRCRPGSDAEVGRMDFADNPVALGEWIGIEPDSDTAHIYQPEDVRSHVRQTLLNGVVLAVPHTKTRWGTIERGERSA